MPLPSSALLAARHRQLREALSARGLEALVVTALPNIRYLTNHAGSAGVLVATASTFTLVVDGRYSESVRARQDSPEACPELQVRPVPTSYDEVTLDVLAELGVRRPAFEAAHVSVARHGWWTRTAQTRGLALEFVQIGRAHV